MSFEWCFKNLVVQKHFLKQIKASLKKSPKTKEDGGPAGCLLSPNEVSNTGTGLYQLDLLTKELCRNTQTTKVIVKTIDFYSQTSNRVPLLKIIPIPIQYIEHGEIKFVPI